MGFPASLLALRSVVGLYRNVDFWSGLVAATSLASVATNIVAYSCMVSMLASMFASCHIMLLRLMEIEDSCEQLARVNSTHPGQPGDFSAKMRKHHASPLVNLRRTAVQQCLALL